MCKKKVLASSGYNARAVTCSSRDDTFVGSEATRLTISLQKASSWKWRGSIEYRPLVMRENIVFNRIGILLRHASSWPPEGGTKPFLRVYGAVFLTVCRGVEG